MKSHQPFLPLLLLITGPTLAAAQGTLQIRFENTPLAASPGNFRVLRTYSESGVVFWNSYGVDNLIAAGGGIANLPDNGIPYLQVPTSVRLAFSFESGQYFDLVSFDAAEYGTNYAASTLTMVGFREMGATVTNYFTLDGIDDGTGPLQDFQTFHPDGQFQHVFRVEIFTDRWSLDNVVFGNVPEPSGVALLGLGVLTLAMRRSRTSHRSFRPCPPFR